MATVGKQCFCCKKLFGAGIVDEADPTSIGCVTDGLIFRATGNYGSGVFDPCPDNGYIEVLICDECIMKNLPEVTRVKNIRTHCVADVSIFDPRGED